MMHQISAHLQHALFTIARNYSLLLPKGGATTSYEERRGTRPVGRKAKESCVPMTSKHPEKLPSNDPPSVRIKLFWLEASGSGSLGIGAVVLIVFLLLAVRYLPA